MSRHNEQGTAARVERGERCGCGVCIEIDWPDNPKSFSKQPDSPRFPTTPFARVPITDRNEK